VVVCKKVEFFSLNNGRISWGWPLEEEKMVEGGEVMMKYWRNMLKKIKKKKKKGAAVNWVKKEVKF
jgi:hypothetical protein